MADCSHCSEELARLTEENVALRRAALAFGGLAERLNLALQEERRSKQHAPAGSSRDTIVEPVSRGKSRMRA